MITIKGKLLEKFNKRDGKGQLLVFYVPRTGLIKGVYGDGVSLGENLTYVASGNMIIRNNEPFFYFNEVDLSDE